jgi:hypothetical protein
VGGPVAAAVRMVLVAQPAPASPAAAQAPPPDALVPAGTTVAGAQALSAAALAQVAHAPAEAVAVASSLVDRHIGAGRWRAESPYILRPSDLARPHIDRDHRCDVQPRAAGGLMAAKRFDACKRSIDSKYETLYARPTLSQNRLRRRAGGTRTRDQRISNP